MELMQGLKRERAVLRSYLTRQKDSIVDKEVLKDKGERLFGLDEKIKTALDIDDEESYVLELESVEHYRSIFFSLLSKCENARGEVEPISTTVKAARMQLPQIRLPVFNGEPAQWLQFWGQFQKIHDSEEIREEDKYQYLLMSTSGKAKRLVESFPPAPGSYSKVIQNLKGRFAKENVLIHFYIRNITTIMLKQVNNPLNLSELYDELRTNLNSLQALGLTSDKYALMLLPLVESSLPTNLLKTWEKEKCKNIKDISGSVCSLQEIEAEESDLDALMEFLRLEVEYEEKV